MPNTEYDLTKAFEAIEEELISSMIRNMKRHKFDEIDEKKRWTMWQAEQLKSLEQYKHGNQRKFHKGFMDINGQIEALIRTSHADGAMNQEAYILNAIKKGFPAKRIIKGGTAEFFRLNDRKLNALVKATIHDISKAEISVLRQANDQYRKIIYNAQVYANTGAGTYDKAVDMATKDFLSAGINSVTYSNGARHTLPDYTRMAIRTASKRTYLQGEGMKRQEWGVHTVIVNKRGNPCPLCLPFVGKVFIDDVWSRGSAKDGPYPLLSTAISAGLYHPNCKDSHTTYFPDISTPPDNGYSKKDIKKIEQNEKKEAREQYVDRQINKYERLSRFSLDQENKEKYQAKVQQWKKEREI